MKQIKITLAAAAIVLAIGTSAFTSKKTLTYQGQTSLGVWTSISTSDTTPCDETPNVVCIRELSNGVPDGNTFGIGFYVE